MDPVRSSEDSFSYSKNSDENKGGVASNGVEWFRAHVYLAMLGGACVLVLLGAAIVSTKTTAPQPSEAVAWGGTGAVLFPSTETFDEQDPRALVRDISSGVSLNYILPVPQKTIEEVPRGQSTGFDFNSFIAMLSAENQPSSGSTQSNSSAVSDAYAFIPSGYVSVASSDKPRTAQEQALYEYGNEVGSLIQAFEQENPNESQVLYDQAQDRADAGKAAALTRLAQALSGLGDALLAIDNVPAVADVAHKALAQSYKTLGQKLLLVPQTKSDADFVAAVNAYNASADTFVKSYVSVANIFVINGVTFSQVDAGSLFTFSPAGAL